MKQKIYNYAIHLFDQKDPILITQEQGQKLMMVLATDPSRRFVMIDDEMVNTSSIKQIVKTLSTVFNINTQKLDHEVRELTQGEVETQKMFDAFKNKKLLLN